MPSGALTVCRLSSPECGTQFLNLGMPGGRRSGCHGIRQREPLRRQKRLGFVAHPSHFRPIRHRDDQSDRAPGRAPSARPSTRSSTRPERTAQASSAAFIRAVRSRSVGIAVPSTAVTGAASRTLETSQTASDREQLSYLDRAVDALETLVPPGVEEVGLRGSGEDAELDRRRDDGVALTQQQRRGRALEREPVRRREHGVVGTPAAAPRGGPPC